jgi:hypothetical protein
MEDYWHATLLIDPSDDFHVITGRGGVWRIQETALWHFSETSESIIDSSQYIGSGLDLVIDQNEKFHSTYSKGGVVYTFKENSTWQIEFTDHEASNSHGSPLALGPTNEIAFVYRGFLSPHNQSYFLAMRTQTGWIKSVIPEIGYASDIDIAIDSQGVVHISYLKSNGLHYWYDPTSGMTSSQIVDVGTSYSLAMVIGANDQPCIAYDVRFSGLKYACSNGIDWTTNVVRAINAHSISLVHDSSGRPHIVYIQGDIFPGEIQHASFSDGDWHVEPVAWSNGGVSMTIDGSDYVHLSWGEAKDIIHAYRKDTGWQFERIKIGRWIESTSVAVDSLGNPHIAYRDNWGLSGKWPDLRITQFQPY